ncbi:restriction endonuclease subunit S [Dietzia psychralcaliphila]|uniref:restriction endonuclease subunit S n=1 Tax=Dietzia psychralcaliphila TaxID=139021 RepID=UPI000D2F5C6E|nr:restriction endonuclease subunit S [Dietzia psychralcaliphila]PTM85355.1 type I restriction enzyme S subunit [Dietzia psychralcaliphila]
MSVSDIRGGQIARGLSGVLACDWQIKRSGDIFDLRYGKALVASGRRPGDVPVYGTNGQTGSHDKALFCGPGVIIGRKGAGHLGVHWSNTDFWVIDTAYSLVPSDDVDLKFAYYLVKYVGLDHLKHGTSNPSLTRDAFGAQYFPIPPLEEQRAIAATLSALDVKIESNRRQQSLLRALGQARYHSAVLSECRSALLSEVTTSIARGVAPKYADDDLTAPYVINQKCIRDGWASLQPARRMSDRTVKPEKRASAGDVLINSTGTGTLGRVARWHSGDVFVDGHVTIVKPAVEVVPPTVLAYSLLSRESDIEELATGSTGQTELSVARLSELSVQLPAVRTALALEDDLSAIEGLCQQLANEMQRLASVRDALFPELLSGRIRVPIEGDNT